jgi:hypothetical protein
MATDRVLAAVCFITLMESDNERFDQAPTYIEEKLNMLNDSTYAYTKLDRDNQLRVIAWAERWDYPLTPSIAAYEKDMSRALKGY